jgi:hypothetical protein
VTGPARPDAAGAPLHAALDALRARGAARLDPVRFRFIEALARRAASHDGAARRILDERLAGLLQACGEQLEHAPAPDGDTAPRTSATTRRHGPLAELTQGLRLREAAARPLSALPAPATAEPVEPQALEFFRRTWSRLSADQRLAQSRSTLPENAGPLNSHHLLHRSLSLMRELSPEYFDRFVSYADALLWIEQANQAGAEAGEATRAATARKPARGRS